MWGEGLGLDRTLEEGISHVAKAVGQVAGPEEEIVGESSVGRGDDVRAEKVSELVNCAHAVYPCHALDVVKALEDLE